MALPNRKEVDRELCWDLDQVFSSREEVFAAAGELTRSAERIKEEYEGRLADCDAVIACLEQYEQYQILAYRLLSFAELQISVDFSDTEYISTLDKLEMTYADCQAKLAFLELELGGVSEDILEKAGEARPRFATFLRRVLKDRKHKLQPETEILIRKMHPLAELPYNVYNSQKMADLRFPDFEVNGKSYPLDYALYEDYYEYLADTDVRRASSAAFFKQLAGCRNVTAAAYNGQVIMEKNIAQMRGFDSVFEYLLDEQEVTEEIYNNHLDILMEKLAPVMRRYAGLLQKAYGLDRMTYADLKLPFPAGESMQVDVGQGKEYIRKALAVMGPEYAGIVERVFREKRIDFVQNAGKSTGAFCDTIYGCGSFILCSWQGQMADLFTVAHELGHAVNFGLLQEVRSKYDFDVSTYLVEAPSTFCELVLAEWLREEFGASERAVAAALIGNTFYHNFVTHFLEGYYQREVYRSVERGDSVNAESLSAIYKSVLERFWGDAVELTDGCELTWMRQPHYYSGLYSYTYSASLSIAVAVWKKMKQDPEGTFAKWKTFLETGRTKSPAESARELGIDLASGEHVRLAIETIGEMVDALAAE